LISGEIRPLVNILGTLARHQEITEEEVAVSKEKKIVCMQRKIRRIYVYM